MSQFLSSLDSAIKALRDDLLAPGGPQISTMRNYRFAILPYHPSEEFKLRQQIRKLSDELRSKNWGVLSISLQKLLIDRLQASGPDVLASMTRREQSLFKKDPQRALNHIKEWITGHIEGPEGLSADIIRLIEQFSTQHPNQADQTVIFLYRAGALYPFFRSSALLKHIDGKTQNIPVVLLYPGERKENNALSFMGEIPADTDYRPRIYP